MVDDPIMPTVEVGRIVFRSWEHEWQTDSLYACSVGSAKRALRSDITRPIYEILERWERDLLRSSLPFPPYGLRIRPCHWMAIADASDILVEACRRCQALGQLCPNWDEALPEPRIEPTNHRKMSAPSGDTPLKQAYEVKWEEIGKAISIDELLREFSPR